VVHLFRYYKCGEYGLNSLFSEKSGYCAGFAVIIATIVSYVLSREWSFRTRGGANAHTKRVVFLISGIGVAITHCAGRVALSVPPGSPQVSFFTQEVADFISASFSARSLPWYFAGGP